MGRWLRQAMYKSYLKFFKPEGLLAIGGWPIEKPHGLYWDSRFMVNVPDEMIVQVYPFLPALETKIAAIEGADARPSLRSIIALFKYLGCVLVQDALVLYDSQPDHPVHQFLGESRIFM